MFKISSRVSFTSIFIIITLGISFVKAYEGISSYQFRTALAKTAFFDKANGQKCIDSGPEVNDCGKKYLLDSSDRAAFEKCVKDIKLPDDFQKSLLSLQVEYFKSQAAFDQAYSDKVVLYAKSVDDKFSGPASKNKPAFSMNWLALVLLLLAFGLVYFINRKKATVSSSAERTSEV